MKRIVTKKRFWLLLAAAFLLVWGIVWICSYCTMLRYLKDHCGVEAVRPYFGEESARWEICYDTGAEDPKWTPLIHYDKRQLKKSMDLAPFDGFKAEVIHVSEQYQSEEYIDGVLVQDVQIEIENTGDHSIKYSYIIALAVRLQGDWYPVATPRNPYIDSDGSECHLGADQAAVFDTPLTYQGSYHIPEGKLYAVLSVTDPEDGTVHAMLPIDLR